MRKVITIMLLIATSHAHAAAACGKASATAFAIHFYAVYGNAGLLNAPRLKSQVTPLFYDALKREEACTKTEGICSLDYFIWLGYQDGEIRVPITYKVTSLTDTQATVAMGYQFYIATTAPLKPHQVLLHLESYASPQCWRLRDLVTPIGDSLLTAYSK